MLSLQSTKIINLESFERNLKTSSCLTPQLFLKGISGLPPLKFSQVIGQNSVRRSKFLKALEQNDCRGLFFSRVLQQLNNISFLNFMNHYHYIKTLAESSR
jgi:hypothetical protein